MASFSKVLFILFSSLAAAVLAMIMSRFFIPKNVGLAGGAMVLGYGVIGLGIGLIISLFIRNKVPSKIMLGTNIVLFFFLFFFGMRIYQQIQKSNAAAQQEREKLRQMKPTATAQAIADPAAIAMGIGIAQPQLKHDQPLYFYSTPKANQLPTQLTPTDSITFKRAPGGIEIATAPPWLVPEKLKLDYQIFHFLVKSQSRYFLQVVGNKTNGQTTWIAKSQVDYQDWPSFLLSVHAVEPLNWEDNPLRAKPLRHATPLLEYGSQNILQPLKVEDNWIQVNILDQNYKPLKTAWIRWRSASQLLITYQMLS